LAIAKDGEANGRRAVRKRDRNAGFSLIELLIVVAIILIIAAIAIPNMLRARIAANEASAVNSVRTITTAETTYSSTYPTVGYTCSLPDLGPPAGGAAYSSTGAGILDSVLAGGQKAGYSFSLSNCTGSPVATYTTTAIPLNPGGSGVRAFCSSTPGVIQYSSDGQAATCLASGPVLQ
jgi:prepilin-type N-terminal cleavage/methylation domain-containing protein